MRRWPAMQGGAAVAAMLVGAPAAAQVREVANQPVTKLSFTLEDRYDSNIARTSAALAARRGLVLSDERATPAVQLTVARPLGRNTISLTASAGYDFYRRNTQLNRERLSLGGTAQLAAGLCDVVVSPTVSRHQSDLADLAFLAQSGVTAVKNTETVQDYAGELRCGRREGLQPLFTVERSTGDNSNPRRRISDFRTFRYGSGLAYRNPILGDYSLRVSHDDTRYPDRPVLLGRGAFTVVRVDATGKRDIGAVLTATGSISYISLNPRQAGVASFHGLGWNMALAAIVQPDLRLTASLARDVTPSLGTDALYQLGRQYSLGATYAVSHRLSFAVSGSIDKHNYAGASMIFGPALIDSVQHTVTGTVALTPSRRLGFDLDVGYQTRDANGDGYDYRNFFTGLRTSFTL